MATRIPMIGVPQPDQQPQQFQPMIDAEVGPDVTIFKIQTSPFDIRVTPVGNDLMAQIVQHWLNIHPQEANEILDAFKKNMRQELDIIRTVNKSKI
jgi:hypothetical protein